MKKKISVLLAGCLLLSGCSLFGSPQSQSTNSQSGASQSISQPAPSSSQPEKQEDSSSQAQDSSSVSSVPDSSSQAELVQDVSAWVGSYAKQRSSASQITLEVTEGKESGTIHFLMDAKGLIVEGDALIYKDGEALCEEQGNMTLQLERDGITITEGKDISTSVDFSGNYERIS